MTNKEKLENYLMDEFGRFFEQAGSKVLLGRIYGYLFAQTQPMSLKEVAAVLKVSKPAASTTLKIAESTGLVKKIYKPDFPRESFYEARAEFFELMIEPGVKKLEFFRKSFYNAMKILKTSDDKDSDEIVELKNRLDKWLLGMDLLLKGWEELIIGIQEKILKHS